MLAGMGGVSYSDLVVAVSQGGAFGTLGASTMSLEVLESEMSKITSATSAAFGVDLLTAVPGDILPSIDLMAEAGCRLFVAALGIEPHIVKRCHDNGMLIANMCGKVSHAKRALDAGCDLIIAQGTEAGGHTGLVATMPLVPQIVDLVDGRVPVVAAGGIYDGRGMAAALALGADGVWIGTRFIATPEARVVNGYHEAILQSKEDATTISRSYSGKPMRVVANERTREYDNHPERLLPFPEQMMASLQQDVLHLPQGATGTEANPSVECYPAGQVIGGIHSVTPAAELVEQIAGEAEEALTKISTLI